MTISITVANGQPNQAASASPPHGRATAAGDRAGEGGAVRVAAPAAPAAPAGHVPYAATAARASMPRGASAALSAAPRTLPSPSGQNQVSRDNVMASYSSLSRVSLAADVRVKKLV